MERERERERERRVTEAGGYQGAAREADGCYSERGGDARHANGPVRCGVGVAIGGKAISLRLKSDEVFCEWECIRTAAHSGWS